MELPVTRHTTDGDMRLRADVPQRVIIAFDQLTEGEKSAVLAALHTLARDGLRRRATVMRSLTGAGSLARAALLGAAAVNCPPLGCYTATMSLTGWEKPSTTSATSSSVRN